MTEATEARTAVLAEQPLQRRPANIWRDTLINIGRQRSAQVGLVMLAALTLTAIFAGTLAPYDPSAQLYDLGGTRHADSCIHLLGCPSTQPQFLLGLDGNARDVLSRVIFGARISLIVGISTIGLAIVAGVIIGAVAGFARSWVDNLLMRVMDVLLAFPALVLAIAIVTVLGSGLINAVMAIAIVQIPIYARVMRASVLAVRERDFVIASRALGESSTGILMRRILPNAMTPMIVQGTLGIGTAVLETAALSFIGLGAQPPLAEWGSMIGLERNAIFSAPLLIIAPGIALAITVLGFNLLGDGLRDALDPRLNR
jgi:ABC-type dipeptide/oligopeptide/nickel transport system permease subunit